MQQREKCGIFRSKSDTRYVISDAGYADRNTVGDVLRGACMNIIVCDDERHAEEGLVTTVRKIMPDASVSGFTMPGEALEVLR